MKSAIDARKKRLDYKWVILATCFMMEFVCLGFCSSNPGLYTNAVTTALGIPRSLYSIGTSIRYVVQVVVAFFFGSLIQRFGHKKLVALGLFSLRMAGIGRSSFYTIGSCTAAGILLVQTIFNVLGTVDVLPLTGVTFPFVSNGGSSMIGAWGLLAFIKAADTRQNASFAVRQVKEAGDVNE